MNNQEMTEKTSFGYSPIEHMNFLKGTNNTGSNVISKPPLTSLSENSSRHSKKTKSSGSKRENKNEKKTHSGQKYTFVNKRVDELMEESPNKFFKSKKVRNLPSIDDKRIKSSSSESSISQAKISQGGGLISSNSEGNLKLDVYSVDLHKIKSIVTQAYQQSTGAQSNENSEEFFAENINYEMPGSRRIEDEDLPLVFKKAQAKPFSMGDETFILKELGRWLDKSILKVQEETRTNAFLSMDRMQKLLRRVLDSFLITLARDNIDKARLFQRVWNTQIETTQRFLLKLPALLDKSALLNLMELKSDIISEWRDAFENEGGTIKGLTSKELEKKLKDLESSYKLKEMILKKNQEEMLELQSELQVLKDKLGLMGSFDRNNPPKSSTQENFSKNVNSNPKSNQLKLRSQAGSSQARSSNQNQMNNKIVVEIGNRGILRSPQNQEARDQMFQPGGGELKSITSPGYQSIDSPLKTNFVPVSIRDYINWGSGGLFNQSMEAKQQNIIKKTFDEIGVNTVATDLKEAGVNTVNMDFERRKSIDVEKTQKSVVERILQRLPSQAEAGTKKPVNQVNQVNQVEKEFVERGIDCRDLIRRKDVNFQVERDYFNSHKFTDTNGLQEVEKFEKEGPKKSEKLFKHLEEEKHKKTLIDKGSDTTDLIKKVDKHLNVKIEKEVLHIGVQTDLKDVAETVHEFIFSPTLPNKKNKFKEKDTPYEFRVKKIDTEGFDVLVAQKKEGQDNFKSSSDVMAYDFETLHLERMDLIKTIDGVYTLVDLTDKLTGDLSEFFRVLKKFGQDCNSVLSNDKLDLLRVNEISEIIDKNNKYLQDYISLIYERDRDAKIQLLDCKIKVCEKELDIRDRENMIKSWQKRFNEYYRKYNKLQKALEVPVEEEYLLPVENRAKMAQMLLNESKTSGSLLGNSTGISQGLSKLNNNLPTIKEDNNDKKDALRAKRRNTTTNELTPGILKALVSATQASNTKAGKAGALKKLPSGTFSNTETEKEFFNVDLMEKSSQGVTKGHLIMSSNLGSRNFLHRKKKIVRNIESVNGTLSMSFMNKIKQIPLVGRDMLGLDTLCKILSAIYTELLKQGDRKKNNNPLYFFLYDYLINRYANLQKTAEEKMFNVIRTCVVYKDYPRISMFLRLLSIIDDQPYEFDGSDLDFYLFCLSKLDDDNRQNPGYTLAMNPSFKNMIQMKTAITFVTNYVKNDPSIQAVVDLEYYLGLIKDKKEFELSTPNTIVDSDYVIQTVIEMRYKYYLMQYRKVFDTVDIDKTESINFERFLLLYKNINKAEYTFRKAYQLWKSEYDLVDEDKNEQFLSFRYFALIADKQKLFSHQNLDDFQKAHIDKNIRDLETLEREWPVKRGFIKLKLLKANKYNIFMQKLISNIDEYIYSTIKADSAEITWIRFRLLDEESNNGYLDSIIKTLIPNIMSDFVSVAEFYV